MLYVSDLFFPLYMNISHELVFFPSLTLTVSPIEVEEMISMFLSIDFNCSGVSVTHGLNVKHKNAENNSIPNNIFPNLIKNSR